MAENNLKFELKELPLDLLDNNIGQIDGGSMQGVRPQNARTRKHATPPFWHGFTRVCRYASAVHDESENEQREKKKGARALFVRTNKARRSQIKPTTAFLRFGR